MFNWIYKLNKKKSTEDLIKSLYEQMNLRFNELSAQVREVELNLAQLEQKLLVKDLKDKQAFGIIQYQLQEKKSPRDDIKELEIKLNAKLGSTDH